MKMANGQSIFKEITNNDIYREVVETKDLVMSLKEKVEFNKKWLYGLSVIVMSIIGWIITSI